MEGHRSAEELAFRREAQLRAELRASNLLVMELREQNRLLAEEASLLTNELEHFRSVLNFLTIQRPIMARQIRHLERKIANLEARSLAEPMPQATPPRRPQTAGEEARAQVIIPGLPPRSPLSTQGGIASSRSRTPVFRANIQSSRAEGPSSAPQ